MSLAVNETTSVIEYTESFTKAMLEVRNQDAAVHEKALQAKDERYDKREQFWENKLENKQKQWEEKFENKDKDNEQKFKESIKKIKQDCDEQLAKKDKECDEKLAKKDKEYEELTKKRNKEYEELTKIQSAKKQKVQSWRKNYTEKFMNSGCDDLNVIVALAKSMGNTDFMTGDIDQDRVKLMLVNDWECAALCKRCAQIKENMETIDSNTGASITDI